MTSNTLNLVNPMNKWLTGLSQIYLSSPKEAAASVAQSTTILMRTARALAAPLKLACRARGVLLGAGVVYGSLSFAVGMLSVVVAGCIVVLFTTTTYYLTKYHLGGSELSYMSRVKLWSLVKLCVVVRRLLQLPFDIPHGLLRGLKYVVAAARKPRAANRRAQRTTTDILKQMATERAKVIDMLHEAIATLQNVTLNGPSEADIATAATLLTRRRPCARKPRKSATATSRKSTPSRKSTTPRSRRSATASRT